MYTCLLLAFPVQLEDSLPPGESWEVQKVGIADYITVGKCCVEEAQPKSNYYLGANSSIAAAAAEVGESCPMAAPCDAPGSRAQRTLISCLSTPLTRSEEVPPPKEKC